VGQTGASHLQPTRAPSEQAWCAVKGNGLRPVNVRSWSSPESHVAGSQCSGRPRVLKRRTLREGGATRRRTMT